MEGESWGTGLTAKGSLHTSGMVTSRIRPHICLNTMFSTEGTLLVFDIIRTHGSSYIRNTGPLGRPLGGFLDAWTRSSDREGCSVELYVEGAGLKEFLFHSAWSWHSEGIGRNRASRNRRRPGQGKVGQ